MVVKDEHIISGPWSMLMGFLRNVSTDWKTEPSLHHRQPCDLPTSWRSQCEQQWLHFSHWNEALSTPNKTLQNLHFILSWLKSTNSIHHLSLNSCFLDEPGFSRLPLSFLPKGTNCTRCPSCHLTNSVKEPKGTQNTHPDLQKTPGDGV